MFGISWAEFLVIIFVAAAVIPARNWPDVARFLARVVNFVRRVIWHITDASERIRDQIDMERPIDEILHTTTDDLLNGISDVRKKPHKKVGAKK